MYSSKCGIDNQRDLTPYPEDTARSYFEKKVAKPRYDRRSDKQRWMILKQMQIPLIKDDLRFTYWRRRSLYEESDGFGDKRFEVRSVEGKYKQHLGQILKINFS